MLNVTASLEDGLPKGAADQEAKLVAKPAGFRRRRVIVGLTLAGALLLVFGIVAWKSLEWSIPDVEPRRLLVDGRAGREKFTLSMDAGYKEPTAAWHRFALGGGQCDVTVPCRSVAGNNCPALRAKINPARGDAGVNFLSVSAELVQVWTDGIRELTSTLGQGAEIACDAVVIMDVLKTGLEVSHTVSFKTGFDSDGEPSVEFEKQHFSSTPPNGLTGNATIAASFMMHLGLPRTSSVASVLSAVRTTVMADFGYVEMKEQALEGHLRMYTDLNVTTNNKTGAVMVSAPFSLSARADVGPMLRLMQAASRSVPMEPGSGADSDAARAGSLASTVELVPAPRTDGAMMLLGGAHQIMWATEKVDAGSDSGERRLSVGGSGRVRRLADALGIDGASFRTTHRIRMDGEDFLGIDIAGFEGPPFEVKAALFTRQRGQNLECNFTAKIDSVRDTAWSRFACVHKQWLQMNWQLNASVLLDIVAETLGFNVSMDSAKRDGRLMINELTSIKDSKMDLGIAVDWYQGEDMTVDMKLWRATDSSCATLIGVPTTTGGQVLMVSDGSDGITNFTERSPSFGWPGGPPTYTGFIGGCYGRFSSFAFCTDEEPCDSSQWFYGESGECFSLDDGASFMKIEFECGRKPRLGRFDLRVNIDGKQEAAGMSVMLENSSDHFTLAAGLSEWSNKMPYRLALGVGSDLSLWAKGNKDMLDLNVTVPDMHGNLMAHRFPPNTTDPSVQKFEMKGYLGADGLMRLDKVEFSQRQAAEGAREVWNVTMDGRAQLWDKPAEWGFSANVNLTPYYEIVGGALPTADYQCCDVNARRAVLLTFSFFSPCPDLEPFDNLRWVQHGVTADRWPYYRAYSQESRAAAYLYFDRDCGKFPQGYSAPPGWIISTVEPSTSLYAGLTGGSCNGFLALIADHMNMFGQPYFYFRGLTYNCGADSVAIATGTLEDECHSMPCLQTVTDLDKRMGINDFRIVVSNITGTAQDKRLVANLTFSEGDIKPSLVGVLRKITGGWRARNLGVKLKTAGQEVFKGTVSFTNTTLTGGAIRLGIFSDVQVSDGEAGSTFSHVVIAANVTDDAKNSSKSVYVGAVIDNAQQLEASAGVKPHDAKVAATVGNEAFTLLVHGHEDFDVSGNCFAQLAVGGGQEGQLAFATEFLNQAGWGGVLKGNLSGAVIGDVLRDNISFNISFSESPVARKVAMNVTKGTPGDMVAKANVSVTKPGAVVPAINATVLAVLDQDLQELLRFHTHMVVPDYVFGVEGSTRQIVLAHPFNFTANVTVLDTNLTAMASLGQVGTAVKGGFNFTVDGETYLEANVSSDTATPAGKLSLGFGVAVRVDEVAKVTNFRLEKYEGDLTTPMQCYGERADLFWEVFFQQEIVVSEECMKMPYYSYNGNPFEGAYFKIDQCNSASFSISYGCDGNCQNCVQDGKIFDAGQCNQLDQWGSGVFVANWNCSDPPPEFVPLFAGEGKLTQSGDWQSGTITMSSDRWTQGDSLQGFHVKTSRGFLAQPQKMPGYYDAMFVSVGTVFPGDEVSTWMNLTDFRVERGPSVTVSSLGWMVDVAEHYGDGSVRSVYSHAFDIEGFGFNHSDENRSRVLPAPGNWSMTPAKPYCPRLMHISRGQVVNGKYLDLCGEQVWNHQIIFDMAPNATRIVTAVCENCCQWRGGEEESWTVIEHDPALFQQCEGSLMCENALCNRTGTDCPNVEVYNMSDGKAMMRECHYERYVDPRDAACQSFGDSWNDAKCRQFEFHASQCNGVELTMVQEQCGSRGCKVNVGYGMKRQSCNDYCEKHGLQCLTGFDVDLAGQWCHAGAHRGCEHNFMSDEAVCECAGFGTAPPPYEDRRAALACMQIARDYEECLAQFGTDMQYIQAKEMPKFIMDQLKNVIGPKKCAHVAPEKLSSFLKDRNLRPFKCSEVPEPRAGAIMK